MRIFHRIFFGMQRRTLRRGDVSLLFTFMILMTIILSSLIIGTLVVTRLHGSRNVALTSDALYASDSGIERGYFDYNWNKSSPTCDSGDTFTDVSVDGGSSPAAVYTLTVSGKQYPNGTCPTQAELANKSNALCITSLGKAQNGTVFRQLNSDTDASMCRP